jgi:putative nucleotidyltransferase with HDIG domain
MTTSDCFNQLSAQERKALKSTTTMLASLDTDLLAHSEHVAASLRRLAPRDSDEVWYFAGLLHDVGKLALGYEIYRKRGALTQGERQLMQQHPLKGAQLLREMGAPDIVVDAAEFHHEWWNGRGYPHEIGGNAIPLVARTLAVADAFAAMTSDRPYREAWGPERAQKEIERNAGMQFDPKVVEQFFDGDPGLRVPMSARIAERKNVEASI